MSTATHPLGMKTLPASGYNHHSTQMNQTYASWKGTGYNAFPVGNTSGHIRPFTNKDTGNVFPTGFGLPRPIKHYRKGRLLRTQPVEGISALEANSPYEDKPLSLDQTALIQRNIDRYVRSSKGHSLGGGAGGAGLLSEMVGRPNGYLVKENVYSGAPTDAMCEQCEGVPLVVHYQPNISYWTDTPHPHTMTTTWCCNPEKKAKQRVKSSSTLLKKNYYTTSTQYLQNRCKTYEQKSFHFAEAGPVGTTPNENMYKAQCLSNAHLADSTQRSFVERVLQSMLERSLIDSTQYDAFVQMNTYTVDALFHWIQSLANREDAMNLFVAFLQNPYWGMPPSGPSNPRGCQLTVYKPSNQPFAKQGAVDQSTRLFKLNVNTISTHSASLQRGNNTGELLITANDIQTGTIPEVLNALKNKSAPCVASSLRPHQNKKACHYSRELPTYQLPMSQPSPYRYYPRA